MSQLQQFSFNGSEGVLAQVRVHQDKQGDPWFVAKDVCDALDIKNVTQAMERLDDDERSMLNIGRSNVTGGGGEINIINESGMYSLILASRKESAKKFKKWVTSEVLPSIRKQGFYQLQGMAAPTKQIIDLQKQAVSLLSKLEKTTDPATRDFLYGMLESVAGLINQPAPPLVGIGKSKDPNAEPELAEQFWQNINTLRLANVELNHSFDPALVAISMNEYLEACSKHGIKEPHKPTLLKELKNSRRFKDANVTVRSTITSKSIKCWIFTADGGEA